MAKKQLDFTYTRENINEYVFKCSDVMTSLGDISEIYFCPSGLFIVLDKLTLPIRITYQNLKEIFKTPYIQVYVPEAGLYDSRSDRYLEREEEKEEQDYLEECIENFLNDEYERYTPEDLIKIEERLKLEDAKHRGSYIDGNGTLYFKKGSRFREASDLDSNKIYYICLFFGCFGLHRFAMSKFISGIAYLLTLGFLGVGWMLDLFSIYFGAQLDGKKRLLLPVENKGRKLLFVPVGILVNVVVFGVLISMLTNA